MRQTMEQLYLNLLIETNNDILQSLYLVWILQYDKDNAISIQDYPIKQINKFSGGVGGVWLVVLLHFIFISFVYFVFFASILPMIVLI